MTDLPLRPQTVPRMGSQSLGSFGQKSPLPPANSLRCFSERQSFQDVISDRLYPVCVWQSIPRILLYFPLMDKMEKRKYVLQNS